MNLKINNRNQETVESLSSQSPDVMKYLKKFGVAVMLGAYLISATGCSDSLTNKNGMTMEQKSVLEYDKAFLEDIIDVAKTENKAIQIDQLGGLTLIEPTETATAGQFTFDSPATEQEFLKYHESLSKTAEQPAPTVAEDANATAKAVADNHQYVNHGGGSNALMWYLIGSHMGSMNNSHYAHHSSFRHYGNSNFSSSYRNTVSKGATKMNTSSFGSNLKSKMATKLASNTSRAKSCAS